MSILAARPSSHRLALSIAVLALDIAACPGWALGGSTQRPPNVVFLLSDDQRPDTIAALGNDVIETPNLDRLVKEGTVMSRAVCANPICTPSRAEILTGCSGFRNHALDFGRAINKKLVTWPATMRAAGYHTWYVGKWHNDGKPLAHGYEESLGLFGGGGGAGPRIRSTGKEAVSRATAAGSSRTTRERCFPRRGSV